MNLLLLGSGAAFVAAGAILAAEARVVDAGLPIPRAALALLATFATAYGVSEWADLAIAFEALRGGPVAMLCTVDLMLLAASFAALLGFALVLHRSAALRWPLIPIVEVAVTAAWVLGLGARLHAADSVDPALPRRSVEAMTRCLLGLPAAACAAWGLLAFARSVEAEDWRMARLVRAAGLLFLVFGVTVAISIVPGGPSPAWPFTPGDLGQRMGVAVEVLRSASGAAVAFLLSEAFVFHTTQRLRREETCLRDDFISLVTHEVGNPVAALEFATERLERSRRAARPVDARLVDDVRACAATLRRIVMDLRDTSRIHARELEIVPERLALLPALERAATVLAPAQGRGPPVVLDCAQDLPVVSADPARLDQVIANLLTNAAKYSRHGSPVVVRAESCGREVLVRVVNEGPRIAPADTSRIFSRHYRTPSAVRGSAPGLGLGLYVARGLVEAHGGRIWVESDDRQTAFCFTLPCAGPVADPAVGAGGAPTVHA